MVGVSSAVAMVLVLVCWLDLLSPLQLHCWPLAPCHSVQWTDDGLGDGVLDLVQPLGPSCSPTPRSSSSHTVAKACELAHVPSAHAGHQGSP